MTTATEQLKDAYFTFLEEYDKFTVKGNKSAGTRARKALLEVGKLTKTVRTEIQATKNSG